ncbi:putative gustatory receptor 28b [Zophobas morio]|uniref:putative gustatory receptor 28b n=1 Tax=Zophobas morio TaxID=2755281 RepID=UPI0030828E4E
MITSQYVTRHASLYTLSQMVSVKEMSIVTTPQETLLKIYSSLRPIYAVCKAIGLNTVNITENGNLKPEKCSLYLNFGFYVTMYSLVTIYTLFSILSTNKSFVIANKYIFFTECCVMTTLMLVVVIFTFLFRKVQTKAFDLLSHIDVCFTKNGFSLPYKDLQRTNYIILSMIGVSLLLRLSLLLLTMHVDFIQQTALLFSATIKTFSKYQFVVFVLQLQARFTKINSIIRSFYKDSRLTKLVLNPAVRSIPERLYTLCRLHYKLASVLQKINAAFAVQLLVSIAVSLFDVLFQSYYLYYVATGKATVASVFMVMNPLVWLLDETIEVYWLVYACSSTCDQANETPTNLHELRNNYFEMDIETHVQTYSLQMLHQKVQFSVLGFFVVDYTLIYSIVGAVTTYLVIFIQFDQSSSVDNSSDGLNNSTLGLTETICGNE